MGLLSSGTIQVPKPSSHPNFSLSGQTRQTSTMPGGVQDRRVEGTLSAAQSTGSAIPGFVPPLIPLFIALTGKAVAAPSNVQPGRSLLTLSPVSAGNPPPTMTYSHPPTQLTNHSHPQSAWLEGAFRDCNGESNGMELPLETRQAEAICSGEALADDLPGYSEPDPQPAYQVSLNPNYLCTIL